MRKLLMAMIDLINKMFTYRICNYTLNIDPMNFKICEASEN